MASFNTKTAPAFGVKRVVIDAGHGGKDSGCLGASSKEKDVCLAIALKLGKFIEENLKGVEVIYTRKTDVFIELHERANIANKNKADLFVCIHANSGPKGSRGAETYIMGLHKSDANLAVAKRENASILMEDNYKTNYEGFDPNSDESYIIFNLMQSAYQEHSTKIAQKIQNHFKTIGRRNRGVKQAGFLVLYRTTMPSVLIETGFLTDKEEEKFLNDSASQSKISSAIFEAFKEYKQEIEKNLEGMEEIPVKKETVKEKKQEEKEVQNPPLYDYNDDTKVKKQLAFKVQLFSASTQMELKPENFKGLESVREYKDGSIYKYVAGNAKNMEEATQLQSEIREKGYKDAFVVAFYKGKRIPMSKAMKLMHAEK